MPESLAPALLNDLYSYVVIGALSSARFVGVITVMPLFTRMGLTGLLRNSVAMMLAMPVVPFVYTMMTPFEAATLGGIGLLILKEAFVGFLLGVLFSIPVWAVETAGEIIDLQRGSSAAQLFDPLFNSELNITGTLFSIIMVALFFTSGAFMMMIGGIYDSYALWPPMEMWPVFDTDNTPKLILSMLDKVMSMAVVIGGPIIVTLLLTDISLAFVSRAAPNMQVFDLSLSLKNLVFVILMVIYCVFMIKYMNNNVSFLLDIPDLLEEITPFKQ